MTTASVNTTARGITPEEKKVIFASSLGTVFEWYDFYLYGSLAAIIAKQFFAGTDPNTAFMDPFAEIPTVVMYGDIKDPITQQRYERDPRWIAQKAPDRRPAGSNCGMWPTVSPRRVLRCRVPWCAADGNPDTRAGRRR